MRFDLRRRTTRRVGALLIWCVVSLAAARAQHAVTIAGLGTATFPTSTHSPEAQQDFMRGLLLLHLFEYDDAAKAFVDAEQADPSFAMAYWGEAMTFNHPVWNELDAARGRAALDKFAPTPEARAARIEDPRERAWMSAVEILYAGDGAKAQRDARYADAMEKLSESYPKDDEARLFYALALLGRSEGVRDLPAYLKAAALARAVYARNPNHPGAAHYWIHGMDDPQHAAGALVAARALSAIAPDAPHAQHMCSHIFLALGMWAEVVHANVLATEGTNRVAAARGRPPVRCGHYNYWLEYGLIEQGRIAEAEQVLAGCHEGAQAEHLNAARRNAIDADDTRTGSFVVMQGTYLLDVAPPLNSVPALLNINLDGAVLSELRRAYSRGIADASAGDVTAAQSELANLEQLLPRMPSLFELNQVPEADPDRTVPEIEHLQLQAALAGAKGNLSDAVALLEKAVALGKNLSYAFGPPDPLQPTGELLGEMLLRAHKPADAIAAFTTQLEQTPNRTQTLLGLARAQSQAGNADSAAQTARKLLAIWDKADATYEPRREAQELAYPGTHRGAHREQAP